VDYFNGRVIFNSPIPTGSIVKAEYSYKYINVLYANNMPWYKKLQANTLQPTANFLDSDDGPWNIPPESRAQLPLIAIEIVPSRTFRGYQLGGGQWVFTDVLFHCIAEDEVTRNRIVDIISLQNDKSVHLFNSNKINANQDFPLNYKGTPVSGALRYPDLVSNYNGGKLKLTKTTVQEMVMHNTTIFGGVVRMTTEGVKTNI
jgi:acyl-CoA hydrolase